MSSLSSCPRFFIFSFASDKLVKRREEIGNGLNIKTQRAISSSEIPAFVPILPALSIFSYLFSRTISQQAHVRNSYDPYRSCIVAAEKVLERFILCSKIFRLDLADSMSLRVDSCAVKFSSHVCFSKRYSHASALA